MEDKARAALLKYNMLTRGDSVVVGLSGGADSCALLHFLCSLREKMSLKIYACHVNHCLRGEAADSDEEFSRSLCQKLKVELFVLRADIKSEALLRRMGTEQCGREVRYEFFYKKAEELDAKIATAHTASDNAETVIFNLARGSGLSGLCGIPPVRDRIIRPLIECTREDIESYCKAKDLDYVTDATNFERDYNRNRIRLDVIPVLRGINPSVTESLCAMSGRLREAEDFIKTEAQKALTDSQLSGGYDAIKLNGLHNAVFSEAVRILCRKFEIIPESKHIELIRKIVYNGGALEIKNGVFAVCTQNKFRITRMDRTKSLEEIPFCLGKITIQSKEFEISVVDIDKFSEQKKFAKNFFDNSPDYDTIPLTSVFRTRRGGDVFSIKNRNVTKPLRKLLSELKVPAEERDSIAVLSQGSRILWTEITGASRECAITEKTKRVLVITRV